MHIQTNIERVEYIIKRKLITQHLFTWTITCKLDNTIYINSLLFYKRKKYLTQFKRVLYMKQFHFVGREETSQVLYKDCLIKLLLLTLLHRICPVMLLITL